MLFSLFLFFFFLRPGCSFFLCICVGCRCCCCVELCFILNYGFCFVVFCQNHILCHWQSPTPDPQPPTRNLQPPPTQPNHPVITQARTHLHARKIALGTIPGNSRLQTLCAINENLFVSTSVWMGCCCHPSSGRGQRLALWNWALLSRLVVHFWRKFFK